MATKEERAKTKADVLSKIPFGFPGGKELQDILDKGSATPGEMDILRARRSYLTKEQLEQFGIELEEDASKKKATKEEPAAPPSPTEGEATVPEETAKEKKEREKTEKEEAKKKEKTEKEAAKQAEKDKKAAEKKKGK